jgi:hypothetical protein
VISIVPATVDHARAIVLRPGDAAEIAALGVTQEEGLRTSLERAVWADAYLVDGEVAAILGCGFSSLLGGHATPWLITGVPIERVRKSFAKLAKARIAELHAQYGTLVNYVHADYRASLRFMAWLGFVVGEPQPVGPLGASFCRVSMGAV